VLRQSLMGTLGGSSEDRNDDRNTDSEECVQKVSGGNKDSIKNWTRGHSHYIVAKSLATFFSP
jgi:hypothetical protein